MLNFFFRLDRKSAQGKNGFNVLFDMLTMEDKKRNANPNIFSVGHQNVPKNRYHDIVPYNETRVKLKTVSASPIDDYINASHMPVCECHHQ